MALTLDPATKVIFVPQADLTFISGALYELDSDQFRKDVWDLLSSEPYIWMPIAFIHNTEVTVAGTTFARTLEFINGYSVTFEDLVYSVRIVGSNNNIFDVENGILNPSGNVMVISTNSAGLITVTTGSGVVPSDVTDIKNAIFDELIQDSESFRTSVELMRQRIDLAKLKPNTYADDAGDITNADYTITSVDNGDGTKTVTRT